MALFGRLSSIDDDWGNFSSLLGYRIPARIHSYFCQNMVFTPNPGIPGILARILAHDRYVLRVMLNRRSAA